jgi:hypothetical protein
MAPFVLSRQSISEILISAGQSSSSVSGGNSTVTRIVFDGKEYAVKDYSRRTNGAQRLAQEFAALQLVHANFPRRFAEPIAVADDRVRAIHAWIGGQRPKLNQFTVDCMIDILGELHGLSRRIPPGAASPATDQVLASQALVDQIRARASVLSTQDEEVANFTRDRLLPVLSEIRRESFEKGQCRLTLSLSDFGPHNLLWDESVGEMRCVDLEFFGWDDAHKLICDALLHPLAEWSPPLASDFLTRTVGLFELEPPRLVTMWSLLCLKWATICLARAGRDFDKGEHVLGQEALKRATVYVDRAEASVKSMLDIVGQVSR